MYCTFIQYPVFLRLHTPSHPRPPGRTFQCVSSISQVFRFPCALSIHPTSHQRQRPFSTARKSSAFPALCPHESTQHTIENHPALSLSIRVALGHRSTVDWRHFGFALPARRFALCQPGHRRPAPTTRIAPHATTHHPTPPCTTLPSRHAAVGTTPPARHARLAQIRHHAQHCHEEADLGNDKEAATRGNREAPALCKIEAI